MNNIELLPCPFCGRIPDIEDDETLHKSGTFWRETEFEGIRSYHRYKDRLPTDNACWVISCPVVSGGCGVEINGDSREEAILAWNRRTQPQQKPVGIIYDGQPAMNEEGWNLPEGTLLYTPPKPERRPLSKEALTAWHDENGRDQSNVGLAEFISGVRFAELHHGVFAVPKE